MMQIPEALVRYLASLSNSVKHHNENERPYSTIRISSLSSSSSMITINIKLGETTEPRKVENPSHPYPRAKKNKKTSRWAIRFNIQNTRHRIEQDIMFIAGHMPHGKSFQFIIGNETTLRSFFYHKSVI